MALLSSSLLASFALGVVVVIVNPLPRSNELEFEFYYYITMTERLYESPAEINSGAFISSSSTATSMSTRSSSKSLSDAVIKAAQNSRRVNKHASLTQLRITNMKLHGREDDMKLLRDKLRELKNSKVDDNNNTKRRLSMRRLSSASRETMGSSCRSIESHASITGTLPEIILVSGVSGVGKSALVMKGLKEPATRMGLTFISGKFDLNNTALPMSAFCDAMASLTTAIVEQGKELLDSIQHELSTAFSEDDIILLIRTLPGCQRLFSTTPNTPNTEDDGDVHNRIVGKDAVARLQYAIRRLLKIICTHLMGVVLFLDDLQWSDTATIDLLQSISLDRDIPSLLLVGAYREDEVTE